MAIRIQKGRKKPFVVYWVNPATQKQGSKSFATKAEAEKLNAFVKYQLKFERDSFQSIEPEVEPAPASTLESVFYLYLRDRNFEHDNLDRTLKSTEAIMERYGSVEIEQVDKKLLQEMQKQCLLSGNKGTTVRRKMGIIKAMLNWAYRNGILENLPIFPENPKGESQRFVPPSPDEVSKLYQAATPHLQRAIILGFSFGMRVGPCEMFRLKWTDINLQQGVIRVPNAKKGMREPWREIPIKKELMPYLQKWHDEDEPNGYEYVVNYKGQQVRQIRHAWKTALQRAGITRHIRPYDLRHAFATEAIASGANYGLVAALMGHRSEMMVLKYYQHVTNSQKAQAIENMPMPV